MLVVTRKVDEAILVGDDIRIVIGRIDGGQVRVCIEAPDDVRIVREEMTWRRDAGEGHADAVQ